ncbi:lipase [Myxococcus llanfairpwllgwyngyllgogerychwyrndrobwllllantysiliogogogochensis]|uniref:Lipase n=1 Tax=Myxococcus llanfairpwllgwyngyllgogerychwyrndrobwllllantysiliogogogochensis TaxID=2590453 RepID=A0A540WS79_9BACT|nr:lipase [Myxococcus llanfairpwllgwyngyllgogerychwyrndrobwllllantysiliogogogochensis]TQF11840.1 lipase [Myxococcus llanfairpwllgwyngyllgogerychwyrndrobwllllantysiliogogogochensis]
MRLRHSLFLMAPLLVGALTGCGPEHEESLAPEAPAAEQLGTTESAAVSTAGLTTHFRQWLSANGYDSYDFPRADLVGGSFGGKASGTDTVVNTPVIFIHGNSDKAVGTGTAGQSGWNASIEYFLANGYKPSELYATTWGPAEIMQTAVQYHSKTNVMKVRKFIEAVKAYTGATKVDIITHSMGVTLARKAILGGSANDSANGGAYNVGAALTGSVDTFVGIAGANLGLTSCYQTGPSTPTCGSTNGLYPGYLYFGLVMGRSAYLDNLRSTSGYEGAYRYSIYSTADEIINYGGIVYGEYTSHIPGQNGEKVYSAYPYGHFNSKDLTAAVQYSMVRNHTIP